MSGRYARLKADWMLRGWSNMPRVLVNWATNDQRELTPLAFYVAESCDGQTDFESLAFLPTHQAMLDQLIAEGIAGECREGDAVEPWQRYRKARNPRLTGIHWCVTGRCNLNCRHCNMEAPTGRYGELPLDAMAGLVEQFERANVLEVSLTGGEPFLRRDILDIIRLLADGKIRLNAIYSNGLLITDRHLDGIRRLGFRPGFQISFDGVGAHDQMRGTPGTEQGVIDAIQRLRAGGFPVAVATTIDRLNMGSLGDTYDLLKRLAVQAWRIAIPQETGNWRGATTAASLDEQAKVCEPLLKRWLKDGRPFGIQLSGFYTGPRSRPTEAGEPLREIGPKPGATRGRARTRKVTPKLKRTAEALNMRQYSPESPDCGSCREQPNLLPDGTLVPCPGYVDSIFQDRMPNLLREDLSKIWRRSFLRRFADMKKRDVLAKNPECAACELFKECGAGCRALALTETGNLMAKDPIACDLHKNGYKRRFREIAASSTTTLHCGRRHPRRHSEERSDEESD